MLLHDRQIIIGDCRIHIVAVPLHLMRQHMDEAPHLLPMCISLLIFHPLPSLNPSTPLLRYICKLVRFLTFAIIQIYFLMSSYFPASHKNALDLQGHFLIFI